MGLTWKGEGTYGKGKDKKISESGMAIYAGGKSYLVNGSLCDGESKTQIKRKLSEGDTPYHTTLWLRYTTHFGLV